MIDYSLIPFKPMGRDLNGCDCYGLVWLFLTTECGIIIPRLDEEVDVYNSMKVNAKLEHDVPLVDSIKVDSPIRGDIVLMRVKGVTAHVGVMLDNQMFMHTSSHTGVVVENINSPRVKNRIEEFRRVKDNNTN